MSFRYASLGLGALILAALLAAPASFAQQRQALPIASAPYDGSTVSRGGEVLRHFDPTIDTQVVLGVGEGGVDGYVFGPNNYGDLAKAVCFDLPEGQTEITVDQVNIYLVSTDSPNSFEYEVVLFEGAPGFDGDEGAGPQAEIYSQAFSIFGVEGRPEDVPVPVEEHVLDTPQTVSGPFCVGLRWEVGAGLEDIAIVATEELAEPSPYEWEQWSDGLWYNMSDAWTAVGWHAWLEVIYTGTGTATEDGAQPQRLVLSSVHPNPAAGRASVSLEADEAQRVAVEVFDLLGRRVATLFDGTVAAGQRAFDLDATELRPGFYVVRVQGEDFVESRRFVVAR